MNLSPINFIILPLMILLIVIVLRDILPIIRIRLSGWITWKRSFILAGVYLGVLILLVPILYMLPDKDFIKLSDNTDQASALSQDVINNLYNENSNSPLDLDTQQGLYKSSSHTFKVDTNKLSFIFQEPNSNANYHIFVKRKDVDDGQLEVSTYVGTQSVGSIDFTKLILPPTMSFQKGTLSFMLDNHQLLDFKQFKADITVDQFKTGISGSIMHPSVNFGAGNIIYIRVPKSLEIDEGKHNNPIRMLSNL